MKRYLQAIFNEPISHDDLRLIRSLGFDGVRVDVQKMGSGTDVRMLLLDVEGAGLEALVVVRDADQIYELPYPTHVELRNEPDLEGPAPPDYHALIEPAARVARERGHALWVGVVSNLNDRGFRYLRTLVECGLPDDAGVSVHRYPTGKGPWVPHDGFASREAEVLELRNLVGWGRRLGLTEFGYHTAPRRSSSWWGRLLGRKERWTDAQVAEYVAWEFRFWSQQGAEFATLYQINDGPTDTPIDRYGIRASDGHMKPVAGVVAEPL